jgi:hypothetical protein
MIGCEGSGANGQASELDVPASRSARTGFPRRFVGAVRGDIAGPLQRRCLGRRKKWRAGRTIGAHTSRLPIRPAGLRVSARSFRIHSRQRERP